MPTDRGYTGQRNEQGMGLMDYNARYYSPILGRFISPDTIVQDPASLTAFDRYAYAGNNPIMHNDPSGHCWGAASGLRNTAAYASTCQNIDNAVVILKSDQADAGAKALAGTYVAVEAAAHAGVVIGVGMGAYAGATAIAGTASTVGTAACADGDCSNELTFAGRAKDMTGEEAEAVMRETAIHMDRSANLLKSLGEKAQAQGMNLGESLDDMYNGMKNHDLGKFSDGVWEFISAPMKFNEGSSMMKAIGSHSQIGAKIAQSLGFNGKIQSLILNHHLEGESLSGMSFGQKLMNYTDVYDALANPRLYRNVALSAERIMGIMNEKFGAGTAELEWFYKQVGFMK